MPASCPTGPHPTRRVRDTAAVTAQPRTADLGFARLDPDRAARTGTPEVVYAAGKTPAETVACLAGLLEAGAGPAGEPFAWATRVDEATAAAVRERWPDAHVDPVARVAWVGTPPEPVGSVLVLTAGTSDGPVAAEVAATLAASGVGCRRGGDLGVGGVDPVLGVAPDLAPAAPGARVARPAGCSPSRRTSPRPTRWSSSPAWTARCPAWSPGSPTGWWWPSPRRSATAPPSRASLRC